jgi:hypothetical protein
LTNYGQPENQTNLLVQIAEETGDDSLLKAQYPVTPDDAFYTEPAPEPTQEEVIAANKAWGIDTKDEIVQYTDPVGNTFEAPVIDVVELNRETQMSVIVVESEDTEDDFAFDFSDEEDDDAAFF